MSSGGTPQQAIGNNPPPLDNPGSGIPQITQNGGGLGNRNNAGDGWSFNGKTYRTQAEAQAAQTAWAAANPSQASASTYGTGGPTVSGGPNAPVTQTPDGGVTLNKTPTEQEIANQVSKEYQTEIQSTEAQQAQAIGSLKARETATEGSITARTASRGLKLGTGSALMELATQQERGGQAIQYQTQQGGAAISGMQQEQAVALGKAALTATDQKYQQDQAMSNAWLQAFTFAATTAIDIATGGAAVPFTAAAQAGMAAGSTSDLQNLSQFG
jgi:hypothetical protein